MKIEILGCRGTRPVSGKEFQKYGGNTSCVLLKAGDKTLFFDAGTGILSSNETQNEEIHIFLSHLHYDHIVGLPFFKPLFSRDTKVNIYGSKHPPLNDLKLSLDKFISPPFLPLTLKSYSASLQINEFNIGSVIHLSENLSVETFPLIHPGGAVCYKVCLQEKEALKTFVYATDTSEFSQTHDDAFTDFIRGVDVLLMDCFFTNDEMKGTYDGADKTSWGHSSFEYVARLAKTAQVKKLLIFHHNDQRTDDALDAIEKLAQEVYTNSICAYDGQVIEI